MNIIIITIKQRFITNKYMKTRSTKLTANKISHFHNTLMIRLKFSQTNPFIQLNTSQITMAFTHSFDGLCLANKFFAPSVLLAPTGIMPHASASGCGGHGGRMHGAGALPQDVPQWEGEHDGGR